MPSYKDGVNHSSLSNHISNKLSDIDQVHLQVVKRRAIITSGRDGKHMKNSKHYTGEAIDLRTRDLTRGKATRLLKALRDKLGNKYDVILETDHIHLEYDPR